MNFIGWSGVWRITVNLFDRSYLFCKLPQNQNSGRSECLSNSWVGCFVSLNLQILWMVALFYLILPIYNNDYIKGKICRLSLMSDWVIP